MTASTDRAAIHELPSEALPRVQVLAQRIWPECYAGILPPERIGPMLDEIYALDTLRGDMATKGHVYWLATVDGDDAGFASAYLEAGRIWIKKLYLLDAYRGLGLGKAMIAAAVGRFAGASSLALYVNNGNAPAIAFYRTQGFVVERQEPVQMGPFSFTDYVMSRPL